MNRVSSGRRRVGTVSMALGLLVLSACVQQAPPDLVQSVEALDRQLVAAHSAEFAPEDYRRFVQHWVALQERLRSDNDIVGWPWEDNQFEADLTVLHEEGSRVLALVTDRRPAEPAKA